MLVLSRKTNEKIRINGNIVITVVRVQGEKVRLGIEAPDDVLIIRDELNQEEEHVSGDLSASEEEMPENSTRAGLSGGSD